MTKRILDAQNERVIFETEKGEMITLSFAEKDNKEVKDKILENLLSCYELRICKEK